jgi:hypothetical protein
MAYCSQQEVEAHTGYSNNDFRQADQFMTSQQWTTYITMVIAGAAETINRYCNRQSFESANYTEYHDGRGPTGDRGRYYREIDRTFLPREQPVISVTSVSVDTNPTGAPSWTVMTMRDTGVIGNYFVVSDGYVTKIIFNNTIPQAGKGNVKIVYSAGYASGSPVLADIKFITLDLVANFLAQKRREQEAIVASFDSGTQTIAQMISLLHPEVFTEDLKLRLAPYRRSIRGNAWH